MLSDLYFSIKINIFVIYFNEFQSDRIINKKVSEMSLSVFWGFKKNKSESFKKPSLDFFDLFVSLFNQKKNLSWL